MFDVAAIAGSIVLIIVALVALLAVYVLTALAYQKVFKKFNYPRPWMAWIPLANSWAIADVIQDKEGNVTIFGQKIPAMAFNFWFVVPFLLSYIPGIGSLLNVAANVILFGTICIHLYSRIENKSEKDVQILGYVSGWISIIAIIKFLMIKDTDALAVQPEDKYPM